MQNPFKRKRKAAYVVERQRLLEALTKLNPATEAYQSVMARLDELDRILNRTNETMKTVVPALGTVLGVASIYGLQQFAGVIVPKALDTIAARKEHKNDKETD